MNRRYLNLGLTALALVAGQAVLAQDATTGAISGTILDTAGNPLPNARVIVDGGRGQAAYVTDAKGTFRAVNLIPGQYRLTVTAAGYDTATKRTIQVSLNVLTPTRIKMEKAAGAVVEVIASGATIDTSTQTSGSNFNSETITSLPLGRSFSSVVNLAPGVAASGIDDQNPAVSGSSGLENSYVIDGVNTTGTGYGASGSYDLTYGSKGSGINTDFISEVQIKSFGMDAEFGGTTGGLINAVTKTGDNTFRGQAFAYFDIDSLQAKRKTPAHMDDDLPMTPRFDSRDRTEFGFTFSGPVIKDKLFFFVGYNPISTTTKRTQTDPDYPEYGRQAEQKDETNTYYGKLNWTITTNHTLELSIFGDPGKSPVGPQTAAMYRQPSYAWVGLTYGGQAHSLKYNGIFFNDMLVEARYSKSENEFKSALTAQVNSGFRVSNAYTGAFINPGPGFYAQSEDTNTQMELKLTKTFGNLEVKAGYVHEKLEHSAGNVYQGPAGFVENHIQTNGQPVNRAYTSGVLVSQRLFVTDPSLIVDDGAGHLTTPLTNTTPYYRITRGRFNVPQVHVTAPWTAYFIQAKYSWENKLFIKAGLRWEEEDMQGKETKYKFKASDAMAPRLSVTFDPEGNGKNKVYAFYGKYFEKVPLDLVVRSLSQEIGASRADYLGINSDFTALTGIVQTGTSWQDVTGINTTTGIATVASAATTTHYTGSAGFLTPVLPGTKLPFTNEYVIGWDTQPMDGVTISNRLIHRSLGRCLEDLGIDGGNSLPYYIGNPGENTHLLAGEALRDYAAEMATLGQTSATWPDPKRDYWAYEFEMAKTGPHFSGFFNARLSRLEGNYEGLYRNDNGQSDPNITSLFDFTQEYMIKQETIDSPRGLTGYEGFATGPLPNDRAMIINAGGTYNWDMGISFTLLAKFQTGTPLSKYYGLQDYNNSGELAAGGRGGQGRTPNQLTFDVSTSYTMKLPRKMNLTFRADIFNVMNAAKPDSIDQDYESSVGIFNKNYGNVLAYQRARTVRLGAKLTF